MMNVDPGTLLAIGVMAAMTAFNRCAGYMAMRIVPLTPRVRRILDCLPGAVLVALLVPGAVHGDRAMWAGLLAAFVAARVTKNDFLTVIAAMVVAAGIRAAGLA